MNDFLRAFGYRVSRGKKQEMGAKSTNSYQGCLYTVGFKVNRGIWLSGLEFFGPAKEDYVTYKVAVSICRTVAVETFWSRLSGWFWFFGGGGPMYKIVDLMPETFFRARAIRRGNNFYVIFRDPVFISPDTWTDIKFELDGPATECVSIGFPSSSTEVGDTEFHFLSGSNQLPALYFFHPESLEKMYT